jgi:hypothetical protein
MSLKPLIAGMSQSNAGGGLYANILHVAETGAPYTTLASAKTAAASGDLIVVHPGSYTVTASILKNGVNWHFEAGATVTQTPADTETVGFLNDATGITSRITGAGKFVLDCSGRAGAAEAATITLNTPQAGDYVSVYAANGDRTNVWFSVNGSGSAPGVGGTDVEVALASGFTNSEASSAFATLFLGGLAGYTVTDAIGAVNLLAAVNGTHTDTSSSDGGRLAVSTTQQGYDFQFIALAKSITGSDLSITAAEMEVIYDGAVVEEAQVPTVALSEDGSLTIHSDLTGTGDFTNAIWWKNGPMIVRCDMIAAGYYGVWSDVTTTPTGDLYVTAEEIVCSAVDTGSTACPIFSSGTQASAAVWVSAKTLRRAGGAVADYCIYLLGTEKVYVTVQKAFGRVELPNTGESYIHAQKITAVSNNNSVISVGSSCRAFMRVDVLDAAGFTGITAANLTTTAENRCQIGSFVGNSSSLGVTLAGNAKLVESRIDLSAGTNKTAITVTGGTPTIEGTVAIGTGTGKDINVTGGSVSVAGGYGSGTNGNFRTSGTVNFLVPV